MFRRVFLFLSVNFLIVLTISFILNIFNVRPYLTESGIDYYQLLIFCLIWGFGGAFISLALSRLMAKWMMGVSVIDPDTQEPVEKHLLQVVQELVRKAKLPKMPEVGIYDSDEVNAFATGPSRKRALVAVSSGLLKKMDWAEIEGVLAHEISHIANGDMVTMTLLQGIVNAFVMFFARILAFVVTRIGKKSDSAEAPSPYLYTAFVFLFEFVFMILGSLVVAWFSRFREYRADAGGSNLAGKEHMIQALKRLQEVVEIKDTRVQQPAFQAMKISSKKSVFRLFSTHPPLEERIQRLIEEKKS
jgi:heat shock protein HtpX